MSLKNSNDTHEQRSGRPSLICNDFFRKLKEKFAQIDAWTIRELHHIILEVSKTTIHETVTDKLGYRKLCARWVSKILTDDHRSFVRREH